MHDVIKYRLHLLGQHFSDLQNKRAEEEYSPLNNILFVLGSSLVIFTAMTFVVGSGLFFAGIPLISIDLGISSFFSVILVFIICKQFFKSDAVPVSVLITVLTVLIVFISGVAVNNFYDISYDGQAYHQEAVIQLAKGWNPVYKQLTYEATAGLERWLNHYTKAPWINAAVIYLNTGSIESGKLFNPVLMTASFCLSFSVLGSWKSLNGLLAFFCALIVALSPVSVYQSLSFYLDGQLYSLLVCFVAIAIKIFTGSYGTKLVPLLAVTILIVNVKLTAVVYLALACVTLFVLMWYEEKVFLTLQVFKTVFAGIVIGFFVCGFNPYVTNLLIRGHPLYPAMGVGALDYTKPNLPENYLNEPSVLRLFDSIFSRSDNIRGQSAKAKLKVPFTYRQEELKAFSDTNAKEGGFGVLFGGIFLTSVLALITVILDVKNSELRKAAIMTIFICLMIMISAIVNPAASLARFVPQFWLFVVVILLYLIIRQGVVQLILSAVILCSMYINILLIAQTYLNTNIKVSSQIDKELAVLRGKTLVVDFKEFGSNKVRLNNKGVGWIEYKAKMVCAEKKRFMSYSVAEWCVQ